MACIVVYRGLYRCGRRCDTYVSRLYRDVFRVRSLEYMLEYITIHYDTCIREETRPQVRGNCPPLSESAMYVDHRTGGGWPKMRGGGGSRGQRHACGDSARTRPLEKGVKKRKEKNHQATSQREPPRPAGTRRHWTDRSFAWQIDSSTST